MRTFIYSEDILLKCTDLLPDSLLSGIMYFLYIDLFFVTSISINVFLMLLS
jgi:hypothetical protein